MTQVYITPTHEQLVEFTKEDPLFMEKIKEQSYNLLLTQSTNYLKYRLENDAQASFSKFFDNHKSKFFKKDIYGYTNSFTSDIENLLQDKVNEFFITTLEKDLIDYLNTDVFKLSITSKIKEKMTQTVLQMLDEQIKEEAKKLIA